MPRGVGQTQATGFQIGVRKTFPISVKDAWNLLTSKEGIQTWLGEVAQLELIAGKNYTTSDGVAGTIRVINPEENIRLTWLPEASGWPRASTVQIRTMRSGKKTTIGIHQEWLPGAREREQMRQHWQNIMEKIEDLIAPRVMSSHPEQEQAAPDTRDDELTQSL